MRKNVLSRLGSEFVASSTCLHAFSGLGLVRLKRSLAGEPKRLCDAQRIRELVKFNDLPVAKDDPMNPLSFDNLV